MTIEPGLIERLRLAALAEHTMYGGSAGSLYDEAADALSALPKGREDMVDVINTKVGDALQAWFDEGTSEQIDLRPSIRAALVSLGIGDDGR